MPWGVVESWDAAVDVVAAAYSVDAADLRSESRGRGPRPPRQVWQAKKMAVHLAVLVSGCDYAALGRHIGFHRDTIASHCAAMRRVESNAQELTSEALERILRTRLEHRRLADLAGERVRISMLESTTRELISVLAVQTSSDAHPTIEQAFIRQPKPDHGDVIELRRVARNPR